MRVTDITRERDGWADCVYLDLKVFDKVQMETLSNDTQRKLYDSSVHVQLNPSLVQREKTLRL